MASLVDLLPGPDVTGGISRGFQARGQLFDLQKQERERRAQQALDSAFAGGIPSREDRAGREQQVFETGGATAGLQFRQILGQMDETERQRTLAEGAAVARGLAGVSDQASYDVVRQQLGPLGAQLPEVFDPAQRDFAVNSAREIEDILKGDPDLLSPQAFDQAMALANARRSPGTTVNVGPQGQDFGDPPKDMVFARNADGSIATQPVTLPDGTQAVQPVAIPIAGGPVAAEREAAAAAEEASAGQQQIFARAVENSVGRIRELISTADLPTTGFAGSLLSNIGGTAAGDISAELDTIKANVGFERLQAMRDASPTGGALGQVSENENRLLQATIGSVEQSQSRESFLRNLDLVNERFRILTAGTPEERDRLVAQFEQESQAETSDIQPALENMPRPTTQEGYDALPPGAWYIDPDSGQPFRKGR